MWMKATSGDTPVIPGDRRPSRVRRQMAVVVVAGHVERASTFCCDAQRETQIQGRRIREIIMPPYARA